MIELAGTHGFRYQAYHFEPLREIAATGAARVLLPRFMADPDPRLVAVGDTVLEQPLLMLYHRQDRDGSPIAVFPASRMTGSICPYLQRYFVIFTNL